MLVRGLRLDDGCWSGAYVGMILTDVGQVSGLG